MPIPDRPSPEPVAIVGMACLFPNAPGLKEYWRLIRCGLDGITDVPPSHWSPDDYFDADPKAPDMTYCRRGGFLGTIPFDPAEFGIPPTALEATDTSQLLALMVAKAALDDAGYGEAHANQPETPARKYAAERPKAENRQPKSEIDNPPAANPPSLALRAGTGSPLPDRSRISVLLGVTGTQELVIPLGARLGHPIWRRALRDSGITGEAADQVVRRIADGYVSWQENSFPGLLGNVVAGRIANRLNLGGTNCVVDAACASSLSAIHLAMMELQTGRCDVALSGGVDALNDIFMHMCFSKTPALSPTGDARPFSSDADGTVLGEGMGIVVLKRLCDAQRDGDRVYAVIRSVGTSSDGRQNSIYAPNTAGQSQALRRAYREAGIDPRTIELVEAHGTGTKVGDVVEVEALRAVFSEMPHAIADCRLPNADLNTGNRKSTIDNRKSPWCALGSVKSQIGHTKAAAGVAGLIKAALALHHRVLPPTLKIRSPNPRLQLEGSPLYINTSPRPWNASPDHPRRAAVSAFGFGGSNFHLVLEECDFQSRDRKGAVRATHEHKKPLPHGRGSEINSRGSELISRGTVRRTPAWDASVEIIALSADTARDLHRLLAEWQTALAAPQLTWRHVAYRAALSRAAFSTRHTLRLVIAFERPPQQGPPAGQSGDPAVASLKQLFDQAAIELNRSAATAWTLPGVYFGVGAPTGKLAMLFPGQGSQYVGMARDLACVFPEMSDVIASAGVRDAIFPIPVFDPAERDRHLAELTRTNRAQPALGAINLGMLQILQRFGVTPDAVAGHSFGELVALHAAGRFDAPTLHRLARERGEAMAMVHHKSEIENRKSEIGVMLAVRAPLADIEQLVHSSRLDIVLANRNAPTQGILSGPSDDINKAAELCRQRGWPTQLLNVAAAFHSPLMVNAQAAFRAALKLVDFSPGRIPVFANSTGQHYPDDPAAARDLLACQITSPVRFVEQIDAMYASGVRVFLDVGPKSVLAGLVRATLGDRPSHVLALDASSGQRSGLIDLARALAQLAALGISVDLSQWEDSADEPRTPRMVVPLVGANYRAKSSQPSAVSNLRERDEHHSKRFISGVEDDPALSNPKSQRVASETEISKSRLVDRKPKSTSNGVNPIVHNKPPSDHPALLESLRVVQDGLRAMQQLQQQTAAAHQRFLEGQTLAHQTFQSMIAGQQRLLERSLGMEDVQPSTISDQRPAAGGQQLRNAHDSRHAAFTPSPQFDNPPRPARSDTESNQYPVPNSRFPVPSAPSGAQPTIDGSRPNPPSSPTTNSMLEHSVLCVVSERTGYPLEHLTPHLTLADDLAIDLVRLGEIASAILERFGVPAQPDRPTLMRLTSVADLIAWAGHYFADGSSKLETRKSQPDIAFSNPKSPPERADSIRNPQLPRTTSPANRVAAPSSPDAGTFAPVLLAVVADLTGYPTEMLNLDMDMEADLGIDSIKRVEILAAVQERVPGIRAVNPEYMGSLRTLRQIVEYSTAADPVGAATAADPGGPPRPFDVAPTTRASTLDRRVLGAVTLPPAAAAMLQIASGHEIWIAGQTDDPVANALGDQLGASGHAIRRIDLKKSPYTHTYELWVSDGRVSLETRAAMSPVVEPPPACLPRAETVGALLIVAPPLCDESLWSHDAETWLKSAFTLTQTVSSSLRAAAKVGGALFATIARMDGAFGLRHADYDAAHGALAGLAKTALHEWPAVRCRALDVDLRWNDAESIADTLLRELAAEGPLEVGLSATARIGLELRSESGQRSAVSDQPVRNEHDSKRLMVTNSEPGTRNPELFLITGGARGVTAEAAVALAKAHQPTILLLGRSQADHAEPAWLANITHPAAMKRAILEHAFAGERPTPAQVEASFRRYVALREIVNTLDRIRAAGSQVEYHAVDVRDTAAVQSLVKNLQSRHGPIKGLIHGAGVLEDRRIEDKSAAQFDAVFDTKIIGLRNLLAAIDPQAIRHLILFSSVTARFGRQGQCDYAMANELLNKAARRFAAAHARCRVSSINWGPWAGGMVSPALGRVFESEGVGLIPLAEGAAAMVEEMSRDDEVIEAMFTVRTTESRHADTADSPQFAEPLTSGSQLLGDNSRLFARTLDLLNHRFLASHIIAGRPVLPVAIIAEWFAHAALTAHSNKRFIGIDDLRILRGVIVKTESHELSIVPRASDGSHVELELLGPDERPHARGVVILGNADDIFQSRDALQSRDRKGAVHTTHELNEPLHYSHGSEIHDDSEIQVDGLSTYPHDIAGIYSHLLFHGPDFHGLTRIIGHGPRGIIAQVRAAPPPCTWMNNPPREAWIADPLVLDAGFQLGILWCIEHLHAPSLPSFGASYRQYRDRYPRDGVIASLSVQSATSHRMTADMAFRDTSGDLVARICGCEWTVDASLVAAFGRREALSREP